MADDADLKTLLDERGIMRTLHSYGHAIDYGEEERWAGLFTEDGVFEVYMGSEKPSILCTGRATLRAFVEAHPRAPDALHKHLLFNPIITLQGDEADVLCYFQMLLEIEGVPETFCFGRYFDRLRRCADGNWRFVKRTARVESWRTGFPERTDRPA